MAFSLADQVLQITMKHVALSDVSTLGVIVETNFIIFTLDGGGHPLFFFSNIIQDLSLNQLAVDAKIQLYDSHKVIMMDQSILHALYARFHLITNKNGVRALQMAETINHTLTYSP